MHARTPSYIYRDIHTGRPTIMHTCMNSDIKTSPPLSHRPQTMGKLYSFIHSGYFYSASLRPLLLIGAPGPQQLTLCRSLHAEALQATASEGLAQGPWRGG